MPSSVLTTMICKPFKLPPDEKAYPYHRLPPGRPGGSLPDAPDYGLKGARGYTYSCGEEYGYFYDPFLKKWMAFDNRHNTCLVEQCNTSKEAENFLYDDTGLFAA